MAQGFSSTMAPHTWPLTIMLASILVARAVNGQGSFPANEYAYSLERDALKEAEARFQGKDEIEFTKDERTVDHYLNYLKVKEFEATRNTGFPPSRGIEDMIDHIKQSAVYEALLKFPKGGNMHTHENHQLSKMTLLQIVFNSTDFQHLYILPNDSSLDPWQIDFFINPPAGQGWLNVQNNSDIYTIENIYEQHNMLSILDDDAKKYPSDSQKRWDILNTLWMKGSSQIIANLPIKKRYLEEMYKQSINEGVTYIESRKHLGSGAELIYELDPHPDYAVTNGKHYLETDGSMDVEVTLDVIANITAQYPEFIGHKRIVYTQRQQPFETLEDDMKRVAVLHETYPGHVLGYDVVGHEDAGNSHLYYIAEFLKQYNEESGNSNLNFYFHTSETKWSSDLMTSTNDKDPVGTDQNVYEAVLLGSIRVGHGSGFLKHPYLLQLIEERGVAIEVCPVSGQILGYFPDLRNHPAITHFRSGDGVVLGSDDAGTFGYDDFNVDWYDVFMAWGFDLRDLRKLALNSLQHSGMTEEEKKDAIDNKWKSKWDEYIFDTRTKACDANLTTETPTFARILPRSGSLVGTTTVHLFGRHFERAICKEDQLKCLFGNVESPNTYYMSNQHIICESPARRIILRETISERSLQYLQQEAFTVPVTVSFGGVEYPTGENFTYVYEPIEPPSKSPTDDPSNNGNAICSNFITGLVALACTYLLVHV